ncbi:unnamed protein product [Cyprideis torosa]|uniref:Uncharacterized protein n=1 Tax=Cyprideis torosa TaxID=163714 RepID=A0A7R8ZLW5_9CRUS|nr:unnamed protein product [Cyprideis torosa]CAG0884582.1 unnamed protein product [Cyprideis torosa]
MSKHGLPKELLPPKKFIGNMSPSFVEKRRNDLELYLREVLKFLRLALPKEFLEFLDFPRIEVACHMQAFARMLAVEGDKLLEGNAPLRLSPLKLHAITERLQLPCPPLDLEGTADDFSHVVDYISQVRVLYATGSDEPLEQSNVVPNLFDFELGPFKSLQRLHLVSINVKRIKGIGGLREILEELHACNCGMTQLRHLLLCDLVHQDETTIAAALKEHKYIWTAVKVARFSGNQLRAIDPSVKLLPTVKSLDFSCNQITSIQNMTGLPYMTDLNLSFNALSSLQDLHTKLGQVVSLDLSSNNISSLEGFGRLFSLEKLDLSCNRVSDISQVSHVASLPCLDTLVFVGNPMTLAVDYRVKVLQQFEASRVPTLLLDHEHPTQKETDKVAVLQALRKAREGHPLTKVMASP